MKTNKLLMGLGLLVAGFNANAAIMLHTIDDNDCAGYFNGPNQSSDVDGIGNGAEACQVWHYDDQQNVVTISPLIAKFDESNLVSPEVINSIFGGVNGDEWDISNNNDGTDSWDYTPGVDDPAIRYWVAKGGNSGFNLFWEVDDVEVVTGGACESGSEFSLACLSAANTVTSGDWFTPLKSNGRNAGLSHIAFYDSVDPIINPPQELPEPESLALFALGLLGLVASRRRLKA